MSSGFSPSDADLNVGDLSGSSMPPFSFLAGLSFGDFSLGFFTGAFGFLIGAFGFGLDGVWLFRGRLGRTGRLAVVGERARLASGDFALLGELARRFGAFGPPFFFVFSGFTFFSCFNPRSAFTAVSGVSEGVSSSLTEDSSIFIFLLAGSLESFSPNRSSSSLKSSVAGGGGIESEFGKALASDFSVFTLFLGRLRCGEEERGLFGGAEDRFVPVRSIKTGASFGRFGFVPKARIAPMSRAFRLMGATAFGLMVVTAFELMGRGARPFDLLRFTAFFRATAFRLMGVTAFGLMGATAFGLMGATAFGLMGRGTRPFDLLRLTAFFRFTRLCFLGWYAGLDGGTPILMVGRNGVVVFRS